MLSPLHCFVTFQTVQPKVSSLQLQNPKHSSISVVWEEPDPSHSSSVADSWQMFYGFRITQPLWSSTQAVLRWRDSGDRLPSSVCCCCFICQTRSLPCRGGERVWIFVDVFVWVNSSAAEALNWPQCCSDSWLMMHTDGRWKLQRWLLWFWKGFVVTVQTRLSVISVM